jgi:hypothetical protein
MICEIDLRDVELELELHLDFHRLAATQNTVKSSENPMTASRGVQGIHQAFRQRKKFMFMSERNCPK